MRTLAVVSVVFVVMRMASADPAPPPIDKAIQDAAAAKKPLVVEFYATWCGPCQAFEAHTLPDARVQKALSNVVFVRYDAEDGPGIEAAKRFSVRAYPTLLVVDRAGQEQFRQSGALLGEPGIKKFVEILARAPSLALDEPEIRELIKNNPNDVGAQLLAAQWFERHDRSHDALARYDAVAAKKAATASVRAEAAAVAMRIRRIERWKRELLDEKVAILKADPKSANRDDLAFATIGSALSPADVRSLISTVLAAQTDVDDLNGLVYVALAAGATDEALAAAQRMVDSRRDGAFLDTFAEVLHTRGEHDKALAAEDEALSLSRGSPLETELIQNRARFATGKGESSDVSALRLRARLAWEGLSYAGSMTAPRSKAPDMEPPGMSKFLARVRAEEQLAKQVAKACRTHAGSGAVAIVRVHLDDQGHFTSHHVLLDETGSKALRECIDKALTSATLPPRDKDDPDTQLEIAF